MTNCKYCHWTWIVDLYHDCPECIGKKEEDKTILKEPNIDCKKCGGIGIDWYGRDCACRY